MSFLNVKSNEQMLSEEQQQKEAQDRQNAPVISSIVAHLRSHWESAKTAKQPIAENMLKCLRQRRGEYDPDKLAAIKAQGGSEIYMLLTDVKCRSAEAWITEILLSKDDKPWGLSSTPISSLPPNLEQIVNKRVIEEAMQIMPFDPETMVDRASELKEMVMARLREKGADASIGMERRIDDMFAEGGFYEALEEAIVDFTTFPACFIKGPIIRRRKTLKWGFSQGSYVPVEGEELIEEYNRVSPFDMYPAPYATSISDGYLFERLRLTTSDLQAMLGVEGYDDEAIAMVIEAYGRGGLRDWLWSDSERAILENRHHDFLTQDGTIDALCYWGDIPGILLEEWGMPVENKYHTYSAEIWLIGNVVIRAVLNDNPLQQKPYSKSSFERLPGSFWGRAIPELMRDVQGMCNGAARALANNMGISSGPQVEIHSDRLSPGEQITSIFPWKIWQTQSDPLGGGHGAIRFFQPESNATELLGVYDRFARMADDVTGIPAYTYGNGNAGGAGRTASGLSMLMSSAAKGIRQAISNIDNGSIEPTVTRTYYHNMLYDKDPSIKGDLKVIARGSNALIAKEQTQIRRSEFLQATANPIDYGIMGPLGRASVLREVAKGLDMKVDEIVPDPEAIRFQQNQQAAIEQQPKAKETNGAGDPAQGEDTRLFG